MSSLTESKKTRIELDLQAFVSLCDETYEHLDRIAKNEDLRGEQAHRYVVLERELRGLRGETINYVSDSIKGLRTARDIVAHVQQQLNQETLAPEEVEKLKKQHKEAQNEIEKWGNAEQNINRINQGIRDGRQLKTRITLLEREVNAAGEIKRSSSLEFQSKKEQFEEAVKFHNKQASYIAAIFAMISVFVIIAVYLIFIKAATENFYATVNSQASSKNWPEIIERAILVGVGRFAMLFFCGWILKYVADLYRAHCEQAVMYRDRMAALGVAQSLLLIAPELRQKEDLLRDLANGYLDFEKSAFRIRAKNISQVKTENTLTDQLKNVKDTVDAIRPTVDALKGLINDNSRSKSEQKEK